MGCIKWRMYLHSSDRECMAVSKKPRLEAEKWKDSPYTSSSGPKGL